MPDPRHRVVRVPKHHSSYGWCTSCICTKYNRLQRYTGNTWQSASEGSIEGQIQKNTDTWHTLEIVYRHFESLRPTLTAALFKNDIIGLADEVNVDDLPGVIGGWIPYYAAAEKGLANYQSGRARLIKRTDTIVGPTNYILDGVSPGVTVSGTGTYTTAGCMLERDNMRGSPLRQMVFPKRYGIHCQ